MAVYKKDPNDPNSKIKITREANDPNSRIMAIIGIIIALLVVGFLVYYFAMRTPNTAVVTPMQTVPQSQDATPAQSAVPASTTDDNGNGNSPTTVPSTPNSTAPATTNP